MRRIFSLVLCLGLAIALFGCGEDKPVLKVYNAGEYIDTSLLSEFERENSCKVVYETFDSNETMYTKVMSGERYDVIIPSDYMIERLAIEGFLHEIDKSKISNLNGVVEGVLSQPFDEDNKYSIPYFWGSVGILYDSTKVSEEDLDAGWEILKNTKYKGDIYMYDSERDSFMIALKALGYSLNTKEQSELDKAYDWLVEQREIMDPIYVGDAAYIMSENENMKYFEPEMGTNTWIDGMVIMKDSGNVELAHRYIDFMLRAENAMRNSETVGYTSPVNSVFEELQTTVYEGISAYVPRQNNEKDEFFRYQDPETKKYCAELWTKVKAQ